MARKVNGSAGHDVGKQGGPIGGGPVGNSGGYSGRPSGNGGRPSGYGQVPTYGNGNRERAGGYGSQRSMGSSLLVGGLLALLLGKGSGGNNGNNGNKRGGSGKLIRLVILAIVVIVLLKSCRLFGGDNSFSSEPVENFQVGASTPAPTKPPKTPDPVQTQTPVVQTPVPASYQSSGSGLSGLVNSFAGSFSDNSYYSSNAYESSGYGASGGYSGFDLSSLFGGHSTLNTGSYSGSGWTNGSNCGRLDTSVAPGSRAKFTSLKGNGRDSATVMIYMCGTDLESSYSMATSDLQEIANSNIGDNVNIIVYTGGCTAWKNSLMSNKTNQIYKIESGGKFRTLNGNAGNKPMVSSSTLSEFIRFCDEYYPADRNMLIFWDHGGGSLTGYGYDQRFKSSGSMTLDEIDKALSDGGVLFDFIGFDACLMATVETAEVCSKYADYLVASEESEPGIGWYYTNWVTMLSNNTSTPTLQLGKQIVDDFVDVCAKKCAGQDTTLSLTDLAEFSNTVPKALNAWSDDTAEIIVSDYKTVSGARGGSKEFAADSKIDQVDLAHVAFNLNNSSSKALADTLLSAVKYNRTSSTVKNAYGLSIYFPYRSVSSVKNAISTYAEIGLDDNYSRCIQAYAKYALSGQSASYSSGYSSALGSLLGSLSDYSSYSSGSGSSYGSGYGSGYGSSYGSGYGSSLSGDDIYSLISYVLGMRSTGGLEDRTNVRSIADYVADNTFDASALVWRRGEDGSLGMTLPEDQWNLLNEVKLSLFKNDGEGFIDLGLDLYSGYFNDDGSLVGEFDGAWLAINDWTVAFYQLYTTVEPDGTVVTSGRVPVLYNGERANLIIEIVNDEPAVVGVCYDYINGETDTKAKTITGYNPEDKVKFVADYYDYDNNYQASYPISDEITLENGLTAEYLSLADISSANACYRLTDIYANDYWTPVMENAA